MVVKTPDSICNITLVTFMFIIIINSIRSEENVSSSTKQKLLDLNQNKSVDLVKLTTPSSSSLLLSSSSSSSTSLTTRSLWESITSNFWNWLRDSKSKGDASESRTFGKIKRLQFALLPIMFKFGVLSTLVASLVFLALKTIFLLKALFVVNLAVIFGKFFTWKADLMKNNYGGWSAPSPPVHNYWHAPPHVIHSPPIIEASPHSGAESHKEIHVHVHTNKEEKEHHGWTPHHHDGYHDVYGSSSNKHNTYVENPRTRRNSGIKDNNKKNNESILKNSIELSTPRSFKSTFRSLEEKNLLKPQEKFSKNDERNFKLF